ncbi:MAG: fibronectin type III domain-containing protein [Flavicella sp.]
MKFSKKILFLLFLSFANVFAKSDKYRLTLKNNPATSIVICWNQISGDNPRVLYSLHPLEDNQKEYKFQKKPDRIVTYKGMNNHFARLENLQPNTNYYFVIVDSEGSSQRLWFQTAAADNRKISFVAGGDSRNNRKPRQEANLLVSKLKPNAVLFGGDMTARDTDEQWQQWFDDWQLTISEDGKITPIIVARGNHEKSNTSIYNLFDTPSEKIYYAITYGKNLIRTYTLNTEISIKGDQTNWLKKDLKKHRSVLWKTAQYHKPMRPHVARKKEGYIHYAEWAKLFYNKKVRLVVECDAHTVKTTWPLKPTNSSSGEEGFVREDKRGTVYVGEGCWGAPLRNADDAKTWTRDSGKFNQVKWIFVDSKKIECRTILLKNIKEINEVSNDARFEIPENLEIWTPSNGAVVTLKR